ncbi:MAG TPA: ATP-grasp peptide maturase system methyltransferase [Streptosporangiaceae bacterium]|nr:ATP-grasp peptide maturase system methyltransferase [Streptosporangiaceae bacterium]
MTSGSDSRLRSSRVAELRAALVAQLAAEGNLRSPAWVEAFSSVPRGDFVPSFFSERDHAQGFERIDRKDQDAYGYWLRSVYTDDVLFTQIDDDGVPTSSSTSPGLMALMLEALEVQDGMSVLEVGTGTGYNAALLCSRLGSELVTSIDIDRELVETARERLRSIGYAPHLAAYDGMAGYPDNAPYARLISTVAVPSIPHAWITQIGDGGRILANLYRELGGGALVSLSVHGDQAEGHFLAEYGGFMPIRAIRRRAPISLLHAVERDECSERQTEFAGTVLDEPSFAFFAALLVPAQSLGYTPHDQPEQFWLLGADGSWAMQTISPAGQLVVCQHGPRMLWDALEQARRDWIALGSPPRQDFRLTVTAGGTHTFWHAQRPIRSWMLAAPDSDTRS